MNERGRQQRILDRLGQKDSCTYAELAAMFKVSTMTIRRDADRLERDGAVIRVPGGIRRAQSPSYLYETAVHSRLALERPAKMAIAREAEKLLGGKQTIFLDGSTTCLELARLLAAGQSGLTIVTNSALACLELGKSSNNTVIGIGGQFDANSLSFVGPQAEDAIHSMFFDAAFVGTKGFIPAEGTFESTVSTFRIKQTVAKRCAMLALLVDHTKFGQRGLSKVLDIGQIHAVVTDMKAPKSSIALLKRKGVDVSIAPDVVA